MRVRMCASVSPFLNPVWAITLLSEIGSQGDFAWLFIMSKRCDMSKNHGIGSEVKVTVLFFKIPPAHDFAVIDLISVKLNMVVHHISNVCCI